MSKTDYSNCWANCLGDCAEGMSGEHYISQSVFIHADINVQGFSWCKEPKQIRLETLKKKILCKKHNSQLSDVDAAARASLESIRDAFMLFDARSKLRERRWSIKRFEVDMLKLERWSLKTLINLNHMGIGWVIGDEPARPKVPTRELAEVAFGRRRFADAKGLYVMAKGKQVIDFVEGGFSFCATTKDQQLVGGKLWLWGVPFYISIYPEPVEADGAPMMRRNMTHWFQTWDDKRRQVKSHCVLFNYPKD